MALGDFFGKKTHNVQLEDNDLPGAALVLAWMTLVKYACWVLWRPGSSAAPRGDAVTGSAPAPACASSPWKRAASEALRLLMLCCFSKQRQATVDKCLPTRCRTELRPPTSGEFSVRGKRYKQQCITPATTSSKDG